MPALALLIVPQRHAPLNYALINGSVLRALEISHLPDCLGAAERLPVDLARGPMAGTIHLKFVQTAIEEILFNAVPRQTHGSLICVPCFPDAIEPTQQVCSGGVK
jgi:hypothetical protein